ncbi:MAG: hypothetical protein KQ78_01919 [Candidatus Izimaplasma bacterium HR2]|nr:MAG: hypothetical protein KQ78_01919 [Candidatus Izimaplasma bacterium HR2]
MIDILNIMPHEISRDLAGYILFFYGSPKTGKTTIASQFSNSLILAFEKGFNALPGVIAQPINKWMEFKEILMQLETKAAKEKYEYIIVDTADLAYLYAEQFIFNKEGVTEYKEIPYGQGYGMVEKEFDKAMRKIVQLGYGLIFISHSQDKTMEDENGEEYNKIIPTLEKRGRKVINRMSDIIGYTRIAKDPESGEEKTYLFMRGTSRYEAGSRFAYTSDFIEFSYKNLVQDIGNAIDKLEANGATLATERENHYIVEEEEFLIEDELEKFYEMADKLMEKDKDYQIGISDIILDILGPERNIRNCTQKQVDLVRLINEAVNKL